MSRLRILLLVNPVAGLGGSVGLKGSDGLERQQEARKLGAVPKARARLDAFLEALVERDALDWLIPEEVADLFAVREIGNLRVYEAGNADDASRSKRLVERFRSEVDCIVFVGGDGTARDVLQAGGSQSLCLGIPAGVKMHSGVFAVSPQAAAKIVTGLIRGELVSVVHREVRDYDETEAKIVRYGDLRVPEAGGWLQHTKVGGREDEGVAVEEVIADLKETLSEHRPLVLGPGSTMLQIKSALGIEGTLRGFDVLHAEGVVLDVGEAALLEVATEARFVISFAREQGFLFGRGNQQMSAAVLDQINFDEQVIVVATRTKLRTLEGRPLLVDSGSSAVDAKLAGLHEVLTGFEDRLVYRLESASV